MVGLTDLGEVAWSVEQFLNTWLAENKPASPAFLEGISVARQLFAEWVGALQTAQPVALPVSALLAGIDRVARGLPYQSTDTEEAKVDTTETVVNPAVEEIAVMAFSASPALPDPVAELEPIAGFELVAEQAPPGAFDLPAELDSDSELDQVELDAVAEFDFFTEADADAENRPEMESEPEVAWDATLEAGEKPAIDSREEAADPALLDADSFATSLLAPYSFATPIAPTPSAQLPSLDEMEAPSEALSDNALDADFADIPEALSFNDAQATPELLVGDVHLSTGFFDIFIAEAQQRLMSLQDEVARLRASDTGPISETARRAIHTLGGIAGTAGFTDLSALAHALELYWNRFEYTPMPAAHQTLVGDIVQRMEVMLAQITAFSAPQSGNDLIAALGELSDERAVNVEPFAYDDAVLQADSMLDVAAPGEPFASLQEVAAFGAIIEIAEAREQFSAMIEYPAPVVESTQPKLSEAVAESEAPAPELSHVVTPQSGKLDLTDLVPDAPHKVAAPVFERRDVADEIDLQLLPIFLEEAETLVPDTSEQLRLWKAQPQNKSATDILRRNLHTLKGSARMVGAMRLGELTHVMESRIIAIIEGEAQTSAADFDVLEAQLDRLAGTVELLKRGETEPIQLNEAPLELMASPSAEMPAAVADETVAAQPILRDAQALTLRVRADWVDRMVNQAGEVAIARSRIESEVFNFKRHVGELSEALIRLRGHIREVEIQAESQMQSTFITQGQGEHFDPLEFDRFTRFQEVTRFLAESVNDISTVHHILVARLGEADAALLHQTRLNRELQQNLLRVRMVPMYSVAERLYRTVRQTARDVDKRAQLDIQGGDLEIDRSVLEKVTAPLEHLLRNALAHGIENAEARKAAGKTEFGEITLSAQQSGNEMLLTVKDDGAGLNYIRIREKALALGMLTPGIEPSEAQLAQMIFAAGFSTAEQVSEVSGRGVGMDVVKSEIAALGGRIDISSTVGGGTQFSIYLPLTLAMTQAVMFSAGKQDYALPTTLVQQVLELKPGPLTVALAAGEIEWRGARYPLTYLPHLLGNTEAVHEVLPFNRIVLLKSGNSLAAILVDSIEGTREIVVKNIGPQLARVTGIAGATVRGDGRVILILNPVPLALRWMTQPQETREHIASHVLDAPEIKLAPLVLVVDDSLTVRKITGRLLTREGYRMDTAKDGVDALEKMHDLIPDVVLLDVEMPRMDGFELARVMRNDPRLKSIPIIMITSRTAEKHRNHALELGVNMYMGKPYQEQQLLDSISELVEKSVTT